MKALWLKLHQAVHWGRACLTMPIASMLSSLLLLCLVRQHLVSWIALFVYLISECQTANCGIWRRDCGKMRLHLFWTSLFLVRLVDFLFFKFSHPMFNFLSHHQAPCLLVKMKVKWHYQKTNNWSDICATLDQTKLWRTSAYHVFWRCTFAAACGRIFEGHLLLCVGARLW